MNERPSGKDPFLFGKLRTRPQTFQVPINQIQIDPGFVYDERFTDLYTDFLKGETAAFLSRIPMAMIDVGAMMVNPDGTYSRKPNKVDAKHVKQTMAAIRRGSRPCLPVYVGDDGRFKCPDSDTHALAYRRLNIGWVPCQVIGPPPIFDQGAIIVKQCAPLDAAAYVDISPPRKTEQIATICLKKATNIDRLHEIVDAVRALIVRIRKFHSSDLDPATHWHHIIFSICERLAESVVSVANLLSQGAGVEATGIVRHIYELALNVHLQWIAPEFTVHYLQQISDYGIDAWRKAVGAALVESQIGQNARARTALVKGNSNMGKLCTSPSGKSRLAPFGALHSIIYQELSGASHQDFSTMASHAARLDRPDASTSVIVSPQTLENVCNASATAIMARIGNEIASPVAEL